MAAPPDRSGAGAGPEGPGAADAPTAPFAAPPQAQAASPAPSAPTESTGAGTREAAAPVTLDRFWAAVRRMPRYLRLAASLARDPHVPRRAKIYLAVGGAYTVSPLDLIPGIIPIAGQLDDLLVLLVALRHAIRACPPALAAAHLERVGLTATDIDADLATARDTARWLAAKGLRAGRRVARAAGRRLRRGG